MKVVFVETIADIYDFRPKQDMLLSLSPTWTMNVNEKAAVKLDAGNPWMDEYKYSRSIWHAPINLAAS